jgi:hypothetical protein
MLIKNSDRTDQENQLDEVYLISAHCHIVRISNVIVRMAFCRLSPPHNI